MELLKWSIGVLLAVTSIGVAVMIFRYNNQRKNLEIHTRCENLFVARVGQIDPIEVRYKGRLVENPYIIDFGVTNVGHKDIASKDFDSEMPLQVGIESEVIALMRADSEDRQFSHILQVGED
jgi:hypothetical protein